MSILVTGGAGYIGAFITQSLLRAGYTVTVLDNLSSGHRSSVPSAANFVLGNIQDCQLLSDILVKKSIQTVIHCAASCLVGESIARPAQYYEQNVSAALVLLNTMVKQNVKNIVFSSSAAVYGDPPHWPITEDMPANPVNPYGRTKLVTEWMLKDFSRAYGLTYVSLRYFNAAGAAPEIDLANNHTLEHRFIPLVIEAALGLKPSIEVYGTDYPTPDGTCIRDYIHVQDVADAHLAAVQFIAEHGKSRIYNLGSELGYSLLEVIRRAKSITDLDIPVTFGRRREGDPAVLVASSARIRHELGWEPRLSDLDTIVRTTWEWQKKHPLRDSKYAF